MVSLDNTITPASDDLVEAAVIDAEFRGAEALVIMLDTPGGGLEETINIIGLMERTDLPIIGYVYPGGAQAWSAGTLILMSSDQAAMAPNTIIGSAQPVKLTPTGGTEPVNDTKTNNAIVALIEEKARMHGRNTTAAREFVLSNLNLNAERALKYGVVEHVSPNLETLLQNVDGLAAKNRTLNTSGAEIFYFQPDPRLEVLQILSNPMLAGLLMLIGLYALIFGISNPGLGAEILGIVALALGLIGSGFDVNLGALFLIMLGMGLILAELYSHSLGVLAVAGFVCILVGTVLFVPVSFPNWYLPGDYQRSMLALFVIPSLIFGGFFAFAIYKVAQARLRPPYYQTVEQEEGDLATAIDRLDPRGYVSYHGEYWMAEADQPVEKGQEVRVVEKGKMLKVRRI